MSILFISNSNFGPGLSGGDRIFLELIRYWQSHETIGLLGTAETKDLLQKYNLENTPFYQTSNKNIHLKPTVRNVIILQVVRTLVSTIYILRHHKEIMKYDTVYSVSDFYADFFPALFIKLLNPKTRWIAGYYLLSPNPLSKSSPYNAYHQKLKGWVYFLAQKFTLVAAKRYADYIFVTSEPETAPFICKRLPKDKIIVIRGGVDTRQSDNYLATRSLLPPSKRRYLACFIGRLHPQKGVINMVEIWKKVTNKIPNAKLAIIGNGDLRAQLKRKIKDLKLNSNIELLGFLDGKEKNKIFRQSAIVVHPATYDSGGMAAAEAMAWGIPGIAYDLESLKTYYPKGMVKTPCFDQNEFAKNIISIFCNQSYYNKMSQEASSLIREQWQWPNRAREIYNQISYEK